MHFAQGNLIYQKTVSVDVDFNSAFTIVQEHKTVNLSISPID